MRFMRRYDVTPPSEHPDLVAIDHHLQRRLDLVLSAEQEAARVAAGRNATLRDRLLDAEDCERPVSIRLRSGGEVRGAVAMVATDHIEVHQTGRSALVPTDQIAAVFIT